MTICGEILTLPELRNWLLLLLGTIGALITIRTYINSTRQRKIDNTFKTLDFFRRHIGEKQIETFIELFHANNELSGVEYNEFRLSDGRTDTIEYMFSEGGCGNGDIHNMIEILNLISPTFKDLEINIIWYEYGQIMSKIYHWTKYLEDQTEKQSMKEEYPIFYSNFNAYMKKNDLKMLFKPTKYYTYAE
ncbi:MAG: hypothetical protein ACOH2A_09260 [Sphingobacteriaceae bacterium]